VSGDSPWPASARWPAWARSGGRASRAGFVVYLLVVCVALLWPQLRIEGPIPRPDLVIHGACFGLLSLLAWWSGWFGPVERGATAWRVLGAGLVFAAGTEVAQGALPMLGRHGAVDDFLADVLGVVLGLVPAWWMSARGAGAQRVRA
jgi:hypothetical protein